MPVRITRWDGLITTAQAAALCRVQPVTIRQWVSRGYLLPSGERRWLPVAKREGRVILVDPVEVAKADHATAKRARRITLPYAA